MARREGLSDVADHFDAIAVGSGFGASAAACRLAQAGRSVLVLERGRSYPPGSFPRSPSGIGANLWDPSSGLYGMFDVWAFRGIESLVSSALGGGSLIYANVLLRKDPKWFVEDTPGQARQPWPITYDDLEPHYEAAEAMLGAQRYPFDVAPYSATAKTSAMRDAAAELNLDWQRPPLAVTFANPGRPPVPSEPIVEAHPNLHGLPRRTCRLCGECDIGCNDGAKNTVDYNYLSRAADAGAEIRTLCEVRRIDPVAGGGYRVGYVRHDPEAVPGELHYASARRLILGAGTFGSTYLLLRNRSALPALSPTLGSHFSGNGDLLTFLRHSSRRVQGAAVPRPLNPEYGPVITSAIRMPDTLDGNGDVGRGFYIEDGGNPHFLDWVVQSAGVPSVLARATRFALRRAWSHLRGKPRSHISADISGLLGGGTASATMLPMLCMGRDVPDGTMRLRGGDLDLDWTMRTSAAYFDRVEETMGRIAGVLGASLANNPMRLFRRLITVHPLGGVPMGSGPGRGVVDGWGEVFSYPGLHVVDGSVMPGPVGPNPSLTIAAFAERAAAHIVSGA
ncbi:MAG TPA: GMC family oxidoreductase [Acidimicrobiales bacterium]|nr:GMC family oxidoreductase [Acidimicrobiales bacterium]